MVITAPRPAHRLFLLAAVAFAALTTPALGQSDADAPQHLLSAASHGVSVNAKLYTYCRSVSEPDGPGTGVCADGSPAATSTRVPVHRGGSVTIVTGAPVTSVTARYADVNAAVSPEALRVRARDASGQRFAVSLPASRPLALLLVSISYSDLARADGRRESGDAHFSVALREHRHPRAAPTGVTTRARTSCDLTEDAGEQRCRLSQDGTVRRRPGTEADCRGGRVLIRVLARGRGVLRATVPTTAGCRYRLQDRAFSLAAGIDSVTVETRFLGSASLTARSAPTVRIDLT